MLGGMGEATVGEDWIGDEVECEEAGCGEGYDVV
jgi:hypothetical protein